MATEASGASADIPGSRAGDVLPLPPLDPAQLGQTCSLQKGTDPGFLPPNWHQKGPQKRSGLLKQLGAFHVVVALLHLILGAYLLSAVKDLHLVALRSWYPFWGAASYLISGILAIAMDTFSKSYLLSWNPDPSFPSQAWRRSLCLTMNLISFFCVLCGFYVIIKDLFLESPFESPIWRTYPSPTVHIQRLELALLCFTYLEFFLPWPTAVMAWKSKHLPTEEDDLSLISDPPFTLSSLSTPPPSYEKATQDD